MTDNTQPEALRLANEFKLCNEYDSIPSITDIAKAEAELREQHARIAALEQEVAHTDSLLGKANALARIRAHHIAELEAQLSSSGFTAADMATAEARGFRDGVASLAASAGDLSSPLSAGVPTGYWDGEFSDVGCALLYEVPQVSAFGRQYRNVPLYTHPSPPEGAGAEQALRKVLSVVQRYLPPDGPTAHDAMTEITEIVDPWPLGPLEKP